MKVSDKVGLQLIKKSIKHMSKDKLIGVTSIVVSFEKESPESSNEILEDIRKEWFKRKYDFKELETYLVMLRE